MAAGVSGGKLKSRSATAWGSNWALKKRQVLERWRPRSRKDSVSGTGVRPPCRVRITRLAPPGHREFPAQQSSRRQEGTDAGNDLPGDSPLLQAVDLLLDRPVQGRVAGMQPDHRLAGSNTLPGSAPPSPPGSGMPYRGRTRLTGRTGAPPGSPGNRHRAPGPPPAATVVPGR